MSLAHSLKKWFRRSSRRTSAYELENSPRLESLEQRVLLDASAVATELLLNSETSRAQIHDIRVNQTVTGLPDGGFVSVWQSRKQDGSGFGIFAQRFDQGGQAVGDEFQVNQTTRRHQRAATIASSADGSLVVTWQSHRQDGRSWGIIARVFNPDASPATDEFLVNQTTRGSQANADAAFLDNGDIAFTWNGRGPQDRHGVVSRVFSADGVPLSDEIQVNQDRRGIQRDSTIAADEAGGFWVSWHGRGSDDRHGVYARRFDSTGEALDDQFLVNSYQKRAQRKTTIAASPDGELLIAWQSFRQDGRGFGVFAQRFNADGSRIGSEFQVNQTTRGWQFRPAATYTPDGGFAIAWTGRGSGDRWGIYLREYNADGSPEGNEQRVNQTTRGWQSRPAIAQTAGGFVVQWTGRGNGDRRGVFASVFEETLTTDFDVVAIPDTSVDELQDLSIEVRVENADSNPEFSFQGDVPDGASIDPTTGQISWTPSEDQGPGQYDFTVVATSDGESDQESFHVTVNEVIQAPVIDSLVNLTGDPGSTVSFVASANDSDLPANTLTFSLAEGSPPEATIDSATGQFSWTIPSQQSPGEVSIEVIVTDDGSPALSASETFSVDVVSSPSSPVLANIGDQVIDEGQTMTFTASATDADLPNDVITYSLGDGAPGSATIDPATGDFSWPTTETDGPFDDTVTIIATDGSGRSDSQLVRLVVNEVNEAPVLAAIANQTIEAGQAVSLTASAADTDVPSNTLSFSLQEGAPTGASIDSVTGQLTWAVPGTQPSGDVSITVQVEDNGAPQRSDSETFTVSVIASIGPAISVTDVGIDEGDAGTSFLEFTVALSEPSQSEVTVDFATADGTADSSDYQSTFGTITFPAGIASRTLTVAVNGDEILEPDETFTVQLSNAVNATLQDSAGVGTIRNDDTVPQVSLTDVSASEADGQLTFIARLSAASNQEVTFDYSTSDQTATSGSDFTATSGTVTFAIGETERSINVSLVDDSVDEPNETLLLNVSSVVNATLSSSQATGTILDDDAPLATISVSDVEVVEGQTTAGAVAFEVSSLSGGDGPESIAAGALDDDSTTDFVIANFDDDTVSIFLSNGDATFQDAEVLSVGDEPTSVIAIDLTGNGLDEIVTANRAGTSLSILTSTAGVFSASTLPLTGRPLSVVAGDFLGDPSVDLAVAVEAAVSTDPAQIILLPGNGDGTFGAATTISSEVNPFLILAADLDSAGKQELISINSGAGVTILENDGTDTFIASSLTVSGTPVSGVVADVDSDGAVDLLVVTSNGPTINAFLNDGAGALNSPVQTATELSVVPDGRSLVTGDFNNDGSTDVAIIDANQDLVAIYSGDGSGAFQQETTFAVGQGPFSIAAGDFNSDGGLDLVTANFVGNTISTLFSSRTPSNAAFVITLSQASAQQITVEYFTSDDTAEDEFGTGDYEATTGSITFAPGETEKTVCVPIIDDLTPESLEQFFIELLNPINASIFDGQGVGRIVDND